MKLELELYFEGYTDLKFRLQDVFKEIIDNQTKVFSNEKKTVNFMVLDLKEPNVRFEEIDGKFYAIYQSKMNK